MIEIFAQKGSVIGNISFFCDQIDVSFVTCFSESLGC